MNASSSRACRLLCLAYVVTSISVGTAAHAQSLSQEGSKTFTFKLPETGQRVAVTLTATKPNAARVAPVRVRSMGTTYRIYPKDAVADIDSSWKIPGLTLDPSLVFYRGDYTANDQSHTLLFFTGWSSDPNSYSVTVIGFSQDGTPYKALDLDCFSLIAFAKADTGGARIIGQQTLSQVMGDDRGKAPYATTYDPRIVYIVQPGQPAWFSVPETQAYNEAHYVWHGLALSEKYVVAYNLPGHKKPVLMTTKHWDALSTQEPRPVSK